MYNIYSSVNTFFKQYVCVMFVYIYIYIYIYIYPKAESFVACCSELYFVLSFHQNLGRKLKIKRPTGCQYYIFLPSILISFPGGDQSNIRWISCLKTVKRL